MTARRVFCMTLIAFTLSVQDVDRARTLLQQALDALKPTPPIVSVTAPVVSVAVPVTVPISTPAALDAALAAAAPGAVLTLSPDLIYPTPLTLRQSITLQSNVQNDVLTVRMDRDRALPKFAAGLTIAGDDVTLVGIDVRHTNPLTDIVVIKGARVTLDRVRVLGDPVKGAKRGIAANGNGTVTIRRSYVDDAFQSYPGNDSQAICAWDMAPGLVIDDNFLSAGSETIMIGGSDPSSEARSPKDITIRHNTITKNLAWQALPIGVKNILELKNARNVLIEDNDLSNVWGGHGQTGVAIMFTVRNQDGRAPYSTIQDVTFTNNRVSRAAAAINILALDNIKETGAGRAVPVGQVRPSIRMARVVISKNTFTEIDATKYTGSQKIVQIDGGPESLTIDGNTFAAVNMTSGLYFAGGPPAQNLVVTNNTFPAKLKYGLVFGSGSQTGLAADGLPKAWHGFVASGVWAGNIEQ